MNLTIVKNSTSIAVIEDYTFKPKRDGGFDTCELHFYSTNPDLLDRWDRITFNSQSWRVAEQPTVKINYETSPTWLYTLNLIENAAILAGYPMPDITFTQDTSLTKTFEDAINSILSKVETYTTTDTYKFSLTSSPSVSLDGIATDEKFEDKTLYQILKYYAEILDAKLEMNFSNEIDFIPLNDYVTTITPTFTEIERSKPTEDYATDQIVDGTNVDIGQQVEYPNIDMFVGFLPLDAQDGIKDGNIKIVMPNKIKRILSITGVYYDASNVEQIGLTQSLEYGEDIFEKQEWDTFRTDTFWSFLTNPLGVGSELKTNTFYYQYGGEEIYNLDILDDLSYLLTTYKALKIKVIYEPLVDMRIHRSTGTLLDGDITYTVREGQNASTVSLISEALRIESDLKNRQTNYYNVVWIQSTVPDIRSRVNILTETAIITQMAIKRIGNNYEVSAQLSTEYNKRNPLTKIISENRIFEIPSKQTALRKIVFGLNAIITMQLEGTLPSLTESWDTWNYGLLLNFGGTDGVSYEMDSRSVGAFVEFKYKSSATYVAVMMPNTTFYDGNRIINILKMTSNTSCDWQRISNVLTDGAAISAIVTDENGETDTIKLKFICIDGEEIVAEDGSANDVCMGDSFPYVDGDFFTNGYYDTDNGYKKVFDITDTLDINKDRREQMQFEHYIDISGSGEEDTYNSDITEINVANLLSVSKFKASAQTPTIKAVIGGTTYSCTTSTPVLYSSRVYKIPFTIPVTGTLTEIQLWADGKEIMSRQINNKSVVISDSTYTYIFIEE